MRVIQVMLMWCILAVGSLAIAKDKVPVGEVVFVTGGAQARSADSEVVSLRVGMSVFSGQTLSTNAIGHVHLRMIDGAFLSLRSDSAVNIVQYHVDMANPAANQIRLDVQRGAVRSVTGKAGEANRAGFRLNTPVAAIGIRGTDFTVFTDAQASSVSVRQGGVIVAPFSSVCTRQTLGACGGTQAVLLSAYDQQVIAEVNIEQANLVPKQNASRIPDAVKPAHPLEDKKVQELRETSSSSQNVPAAPAATSSATATESKKESVSQQSADKNNVRISGSATATVASLSAVSSEVGPKESVTSELASSIIVQERADTSSKAVDDAANSRTTTVNPGVVVVTPAPAVPPVSEPVARPQVFHYGRWSSYAETPAQDIVRDTTRNRQVFVANSVHLMGSTEKTAGSLPAPTVDRSGVVDFRMDAGDVIVRRGDRALAATLSNPALQINFDTNRFDTSLDVTSSALAAGSTRLTAQGVLAENGLLRSETGSSNMSVSGAVDTSATRAGYIFEQSESGISGATTWVER